jgi:UDP-2,4-diacetamido-2,4,6-trideoxy-beta-L-altropyranose hydrolase
MIIVIRVDASNQLGTGHVMRCIVLAEKLRKRKIECIFICRNYEGNLADKITSHQFRVHLLPVLNSGKEGAYDSGFDWKIDATQTELLLKEICPSWMIVDHYFIDHKWQKFLSDNYEYLMVIDDLANRKHNCDILLDQNLYKDLLARYEDKVPENCIKLLGPDYALLQDRYAEARLQAKSRSQPVNNLFIFFGGIDLFDLTELTLESLIELDIPFKRIDVVLSKKSPNYKKIEEKISNIPSAILHSDLPSLSSLIVKADIAIGAGGSTNWERFCLGLPSLVVTLADNQRELNRDLHDMGLIKLIADVSDIKVDQISIAIKHVLNTNDLESWSRHCMSICSGQGAGIVADEIQKISKEG